MLDTAVPATTAVSWMAEQEIHQLAAGRHWGCMIKSFCSRLQIPCPALRTWTKPRAQPQDQATLG